MRSPNTRRPYVYIKGTGTETTTFSVSTPSPNLATCLSSWTRDEQLQVESTDQQQVESGIEPTSDGLRLFPKEATRAANTEAETNGDVDTNPIRTRRAQSPNRQPRLKKRRGSH